MKVFISHAKLIMQIKALIQSNITNRGKPQIKAYGVHQLGEETAIKQKTTGILEHNRYFFQRFVSFSFFLYPYLYPPITWESYNQKKLRILIHLVK